MWSRPRIWEDVSGNRWIADHEENVVVVVVVVPISGRDLSGLQWQVMDRRVVVQAGGSQELAAITIQPNSVYVVGEGSVTRREIPLHQVALITRDAQEAINSGKVPNNVLDSLP
jgi:hypothetical protein